MAYKTSIIFLAHGSVGWASDCYGLWAARAWFQAVGWDQVCPVILGLAPTQRIFS